MAPPERHPIHSPPPFTHPSRASAERASAVLQTLETEVFNVRYMNTERVSTRTDERSSTIYDFVNVNVCLGRPYAGGTNSHSIDS